MSEEPIIPDFEPEGDSICPECGEEAVMGFEEFFREFGNGYDMDCPWGGGEALTCVGNYEGQVYAPKRTMFGEELKYYVLPLGGEWEMEELWDDPDLHFFQDILRNRWPECVCTWCYSFLEWETVVEYAMRHPQ